MEIVRGGSDDEFRELRVRDRVKMTIPFATSPHLWPVSLSPCLAIARGWRAKTVRQNCALAMPTQAGGHLSKATLTFRATIRWSIGDSINGITIDDPRPRLTPRTRETKIFAPIIREQSLAFTSNPLSSCSTCRSTVQTRNPQSTGDAANPGVLSPLPLTRPVHLASPVQPVYDRLLAKANMKCTCTPRSVPLRSRRGPLQQSQQCMTS